VHLTPADKGVAFGYWDTCNTCSDLVRLLLLMMMVIITMMFLLPLPA